MPKPQQPSQLGQRQTRQRDAIFQVIEETSGPLAVEEIYRALKLMLESRQVQQVNMPSGETRYESAHLGHHDHFQCRLCHKVFDLDICPLKLKTGTKLRGGFLVEGHELTISGLCAKCAGGKA